MSRFQWEIPRDPKTWADDYQGVSETHFAEALKEFAAMLANASDDIYDLYDGNSEEQSNFILHAAIDSVEKSEKNPQPLVKLLEKDIC